MVTRCISVTVCSESPTPAWLKKMSPATPMISQGTTRTAPCMPAIDPRAGKRIRVRPQAASVPRTSEPAITIVATISELRIASRAALCEKAASYQWVVKPSQGSEMIDESLNENRASISTGPNRIRATKATSTTDPTPGRARRIRSPTPGRLRTAGGRPARPLSIAVGAAPIPFA